MYMIACITFSAAAAGDGGVFYGMGGDAAAGSFSAPSCGPGGCG